MSVKLYIPKGLRLLEPGVPIFEPYLSFALGEVRQVAAPIVKGNTPIGATGQLRNLILTSSTARRITFEWIAPHASAVEYGSAAHWIPIQPFLIWAAFKLGDSKIAYKIRAWKAKHRTPGKHFVKKIESLVRSAVVPIFRARMSALAKLLSGN